MEHRLIAEDIGISSAISIRPRFELCRMSETVKSDLKLEKIFKIGLNYHVMITHLKKYIFLSFYCTPRSVDYHDYAILIFLKINLLYTVACCRFLFTECIVF